MLRHLAGIAALAATLAGCRGAEAPSPMGEPTPPPAAPAPAEPTPPPPPVVAPPPALPAPPPIRPTLGGSERAAIEAARRASGADEAAPRRAADDDGLLPRGLTDEEEEAADDDPAVRLARVRLPEPASAGGDRVAAAGGDGAAGRPVEEARPRDVAPPPEAARPSAGAAAEGAAEDAPVPNDAPAPDPGEPTGRPRAGVRLWAGPAGLGLTDLAIATDIEDREPAGASDAFAAASDRFYCYSVFDNPGDPVTVTHVWRHEDRVLSRVELEAGHSPKWRTWSRQRVRPDQVGRFSCEVLAPSGARLGLAEFTVGR